MYNIFLGIKYESLKGPGITPTKNSLTDPFESDSYQKKGLFHPKKKHLNFGPPIAQALW